MQIKRIDLIFAGLVMAMALWTGCSKADNSLGKSMGRWADFGLESMIQNRQGGLEYIEVTMNTVIGKDTAGVRDRAAALKADPYAKAPDCNEPFAVIMRDWKKRLEK